MSEEDADYVAGGKGTVPIAIKPSSEGKIVIDTPMQGCPFNDNDEPFCV